MLSGGDVITVHVIRIEQVETSSDPFRHVKHSGSGTATERNRDVTEMFLSVWTSPFNCTWGKFPERWHSATERKYDVQCESALMVYSVTDGDLNMPARV